MKSIGQIRQCSEELKPVLKERFQVETIGIFGSYSRGEQSNNNNVDILEEFTKGAHVDLLKYLQVPWRQMV